MNYKKKPQPYWKHKDWYKKRNKAVYNDRMEGVTWRELVDKYEISVTYLREIVGRLGNKFREGK